MVNRPEDRPKVILLSVAIVVVFAYFGAAVLPRQLHPEPDSVPHGRPSTSAATTHTSASLPASLASPASDRAITKSGANDAPPTTSTHDPFTPLPDSIQGIKESSLGLSDLRHPSEANTRYPSVPTPNTRFSAPQAQQPATSHQLPATAFPQHPTPDTRHPQVLSLDGVILSDSAVAILRIGEQTFEGHIGDRLPGNLILTKITEEGVELKRDNRLLFLPVGTAVPLSPHSEANP